MVEEIQPERVADLLECEGVEIVDIRDPASFERGHIPGSVNVPMGKLIARIDELSDVDRIVTVCPKGQASVQAARLIGSYEGSAETRVESMAGGLNAWEERYELVRSDGDRSDSRNAPF